MKTKQANLIPLFYKRIQTIFLLLFIVVTACDKEEIEEVTKKKDHYSLNIQDSLALLDIYEKANGPDWTSWDFDDLKTLYIHHDEVIFMKDTANMELRVSDLYFPPVAFGTLSPKIGDLTELRQLSIGGIAMKGDLPKEIGNLKNLYSLSIIRTGFESYPDEIFTLPAMKFFEIYYSPINKPVPTAIKNLPKGAQITIVGCGLTGSVPIEILERDNLTVILYENNITELPWEIWKDDSQLSIPGMVGNRLSGDIPEWVKETKRWQTYKSVVYRQQEGYGYNNFD